MDSAADWREDAYRGQRVDRMRRAGAGGHPLRLGRCRCVVCVGLGVSQCAARAQDRDAGESQACGRPQQTWYSI